MHRVGFVVCLLVTLVVVVLTMPRVTNLRKASAIRVISLAEQKALTTKWLGAVHLTQDVANDLVANLNSVKATAEKAQKQIDAWAEAKSIQNNDKLRKYITRMANASTLLNNIETDFKGWCFTQSALFEVSARGLEAKFKRARAGVAISIETDYKLLDNAVAKGLESLGGMMEKIQNVQTDFSVLAAEAKNLKREIQEQRIDLENKLEVAGIYTALATAACVGTAAGSAIGTVMSAGTGSLLAAGITAAACSGVGGLAGGSLLACAAHWEHTMSEQADTAHDLWKKSKNLHTSATTDYGNMVEAKKHLDLVDGLLINDVVIFETAVLPATKNLVKKLKSLGESHGFSLS